MRKIFTLISLALLVFAQSQAQPSESHNFTTYDTVISISTGPWSGPDQWNVRITRPAGMFIPGNPDTASRPVIIMMPGIGEQGNSNTGNLVVWGPHYWLNNGWDGSVVLGNGKHYPILITVSYINNMNPTAPAYYNLLTILLNTYHIKRNSVHTTGLSQGSFTNGALIEYEASPGAETGMSLIKSMALFEGTPDPLPGILATYSRGDAAFGVWAQKYGGKFFTLEGNGSDNFRNSYIQADVMDAVVPGSAYFSYESLGGGAHCCWNSMYDPSATNWTCVGNLGPNNAPSQVGQNTMGDYHAPSNVFQWMLRQGDTSMVGSAAPPPNQPPVANAGADQTITLPVSSLALSGTGSDPDGTVASYGWSETGGPSQASISNTSIPNPAVSNLVAGVYTFRLTVTDNSGATATDNMTVTVNAAPAQSLSPAGMTIPGRIEAESYTNSIGVRTEPTSDAGGGLDVGWIYPGNWMSYNVTVTTPGTFTATFRVATPNSGAAFQLRDANGNVLANMNLASTGGFQNWQTVSATVTLPAGNQTLKIVSTGTDLWNINWFEFDLPQAQPASGKSIPGRIEAANYDYMLAVQQQPTTDVGGGNNVGWIYPGSWMSYIVNVASAGTYTATFRVATPNPNAAFQLRDVNGNVLANINLASTGGWQTWQTVSATVTLAAGSQILQIISTGTDLWNINWMEFDLPSQPQVSGKPIPGKIESENYDAMFDVQTQGTADVGGGLNVGWIGQGSWMSYNVNVASAGTYLASFRIATPNAGSSFQLQAADGTVLATLNLPVTGDYQVWQTVNAIVNLPAGSQTLKIISTSASGWNINWMAFDVSGKSIPGEIEAENYDAMSGVQTQATSDAGGGLNVGWIDPGDWMSYNVNVASAGTYLASFRIATPNTGCSFQLQTANGTVLATLSLPVTGDFQVWQTISAAVTLPAGSQTLKIVSTSALGWNINWMDFANVTQTGSAATGSVVAGTASQFLSSAGSVDSALATLSLYPNPARDQAVLEISNVYTGKMLVQVISEAGIVVRTYQVSKDQSFSRVYLATGDLAKGTYFIRVQIGNWRTTRKLLKR